jgi:hypothetical protein
MHLGSGDKVPAYPACGGLNKLASYLVENDLRLANTEHKMIPVCAGEKKSGLVFDFFAGPFQCELQLLLFCQI